MKEYVRKKVCEMLEEVEPGCLVGPAKDNETIADIFGISPVKGNEFIVFLKIVELTVGLENNLRIIIKKDPRNIFLMKLKDFIDYIYYLT